MSSRCTFANRVFQHPGFVWSSHPEANFLIEMNVLIEDSSLIETSSPHNDCLTQR